MKKQIALIFGGASPEYQVSLMSASSVMAAIQVELYDVLPIGINEEGQWFLFTGPQKAIAKNQWQRTDYCQPIQLILNGKKPGFLVFDGANWQPLAIDLVFPILHGANGEDGTIQGLLTMANIPYVGCDVLSSALGADKFLSHQLVENLGINVTPALTFSLDEAYVSSLTTFIEEVSFPIFVKPLRAGSSLGITKVQAIEELTDALKVAGTYDRQIIVEKFVIGREVGCGIIGKQELVVGGVDEIELAAGFFDFTEKYDLVSAQIHCPARISDDLRAKIRKNAELIYRGLKCQGLSRIDFFLTPDGELFFNEINTLPGFTEHSRFPNLMKEVGLDYVQLIARIIGDALKKEW